MNSPFLVVTNQRWFDLLVPLTYTTITVTMKGPLLMEAIQCTMQWAVDVNHPGILIIQHISWIKAHAHQQALPF